MGRCCCRRSTSASAGSAPASWPARRQASSPPTTLRARRCRACRTSSRTQAGIQLRHLYGSPIGSGDTVDLRGFGPYAQSNTLILVNGRRYQDFDLQGFDFASIPLNSIERIEITRGNSGTVLYGDGAVGGVINIVTKTQNTPGVSGKRRSRRRLIRLFGRPAVRRRGVGSLVDVALQQCRDRERLPRRTAKCGRTTSLPT